jgi:hypothetical protein
MISVQEKENFSSNTEYLDYEPPNNHYHRSGIPTPPNKKAGSTKPKKVDLIDQSSRVQIIQSEISELDEEIRHLQNSLLENSVSSCPSEMKVN